MQDEWGERPAWQRSPYLAPVGQVAMAAIGLFLLAPQVSGWLRALAVLIAMLSLVSGWRVYRRARQEHL